VVGVIEKAAETPNILDSGMLMLNEQIKYQKKRESIEAEPARVTAANGIMNGA